jgi:hypothetical protein
MVRWAVCASCASRVVIELFLSKEKRNEIGFVDGDESKFQNSINPIQIHVTQYAGN